MKKLFLFMLLLGVFLSSCIEEPDIQANTNEGNFEALWSIIDKKYCYLEYKNINWDSIHTAYKNKVDNKSGYLEF